VGQSRPQSITRTVAQGFESPLCYQPMQSLQRVSSSEVLHTHSLRAAWSVEQILGLAVRLASRLEEKAAT
jgi:hypothetical protein